MKADDSDLFEEAGSSDFARAQLVSPVFIDVAEDITGTRARLSIPPGAIHKIKDAYLVVGFDTEYQPVSDTFTNKDIKDRTARYEVLSYQFYAINHLGDEWSGIAIPATGQRMKFADFVAFAIAKGAALELAIPERVVLVGHFNKADIPAFEDRGVIFDKLHNIRNTLITLGRPVSIGITLADDTQHEIQLHVRDTMQLAPAGKKSLAKLGELIKISKMVLAEDPADDVILKSRMKLVRSDAWDLFKDYALRDAEVCAKYFLRVAEQYAKATGTRGIPTALSSIGLRLLVQDWQSRGIAPHQVVGKEEITETVYNEKLEVFVTKKRYPLLEDIALFEQLATECYHGGRNEQFWFGPSFKAEWKDYDVTSAYPMGMAMIKSPDWPDARYTKNLSDFKVDTFGFALVKFKFPDAVRYPTMPVRSGNGIIFPLEGASYCCAPEIHLALSLGAEIDVKHGLVIPCDETSKPFFDFIKDSIARRKAAKDDIENAFWKEATNSCYGKTAQGLRDKRTYNLKERAGERIKRSKITNPFFAAYITSLVRAVIGEMMNMIPAERMVFSVTTDGFNTNATHEEIARAQQGVLGRAFGETCWLVAGKTSILEVKHEMRQVLGWTTRGQATIERAGEKNFVLAKAGIRPPSSHEGDMAANQFILTTFFDRRSDLRSTLTVPTSFREMQKHEVDMVFKTIDRSVRMEYDLKRRPYAVRDVDGTYKDWITGKMTAFSHVAFSTVPWKNVEQFRAIRKFRDDLWRKEPFCIKTSADFKEFAQLHDAFKALGTQKARYLKRVNGPLRRLKRDICRAFKQGCAGFPATQQISARQFAINLNLSGFAGVGLEVKVSDVENAARADAVFQPHSTPATPEVLAMLEKLKVKFPTFIPSDLLAPTLQAGTELLPALVRACPFIGRPPGQAP